MSNSWDEFSDGSDINPDVIAYSRKAFDDLSSLINLHDLRVLDFGAGTGLLTEKISPIAKEVIALDTSEKMIAILNSKQLPNVIGVTEVLSDEFVKESELFSTRFDIVIASSVCSFLPDFENTLTIIKTVLKPGGIFVQWDWLSKNTESNFGLSIEAVEHAYLQAGLVSKSISHSFSMKVDESEMPVLMGVAENPK